MNKVFVIGTHKTGTSTMKQCLIQLGYNILPFGVSYQHIIHEVNNNYDKLRPLIEKYDAFEDSPWNHNDLYKWLYKNYPDSKFILTTRNTKNWLDSYKRWTTQHSFIRNREFYKLASKSCYGVDDLIKYPNIMIKKYESRNREVIKFFENSDNFMEFDIENNNGWVQLCNFLDVDVVMSKFPHVNKTKK